MRLSFLAQDRADLGEPVKCFSQVDGEADSRKPSGSQESCTLLIGNQTHGTSYVATNFTEQHSNLR